MFKSYSKVISVTLLSCALSFLLIPRSLLANVVGADAQNFNPTTNGIDFVTVQSSETLEPGVFNIGIFMNHAVNSLPYYETTPGNRLSFTDQLTSLDFNAGVGLTQGWDIGFSLPQVLKQQVHDTSGSHGEFAATGLTEFRINTKIHLWGDTPQGGLAIIGSANFNFIENNPFAGKDAGPTFNFEIAGDTTIRRWALGANIGYRARNKGRKILGSIAEPLGNQLISSIAASYHLVQFNTKVITEIYGSIPSDGSHNNVNQEFSERSLTSLEWLVGLKHDFTTSLAGHLGIGTELIQGYASPDWRIYAGFNYAFGPITSPVKTISKTREKPTANSNYYLTSVPVELSAIKVKERFRTSSIQFEFDSDKMIGSYDDVLKELATNLSGGFRLLRVEGHTDSVGSSSYNEELSLKRANAIRRRLIEKFNLQSNKIQSVGYGESRPIADNSNYQGRQANRRVEFEVLR